jgi:DNA processing protein
MSLIRRTALNRPKQEKNAKCGVEIKRQAAGWDNEYLLKVIDVKSFLLNCPVLYLLFVLYILLLPLLLFFIALSSQFFHLSINMLNELDALLALSHIPHLGSIRIQMLIQKFGSAANALEASEAEILEMPQFGPLIAPGWRERCSHHSWERERELAEKQEVTLLPFTDPAYPQRLREIADYPLILYVKGTLTAADQNSIAVVGTRYASIYGLEMAEQISADLAASKITVVSGLARGIDVKAHEGALRNGRTIAVIGSGLAAIYPREHILLANAITEQGAILSEFPMETPPDRQNFPQRNRIVSGMTFGTVLIEAPLKSGAMITVEKALLQRRKLFAIPGRADCENFRGNHALIKSGKAQLVESAEEIRASFEDLFGNYSAVACPTTLQPLAPEEQQFLERLPAHELSIEEMVQLTKLPVMRINILLMGLLLKKLVKEFPGKIYKKVGVHTHG